MKKKTLIPLNPRQVRCPRCLRPVEGWPLLRVDVCAPEYWKVCIRQPRNVLDKMTDKLRLKIMRALGVKWPKKHAIPTYPSTMAAWQVKEADLMYDQMGE